MAKKTFYQILGLSKDASSGEIKSRYRKLAFKYHPDRNKSASSEEKFKEINQAYEILKDPHKRKSYDYDVRYSNAAERSRKSEKYKQERRRSSTQNKKSVQDDRTSKYRSFIFKVAFLVFLSIFAFNYIDSLTDTYNRDSEKVETYVTPSPKPTIKYIPPARPSTSPSFVKPNTTIDSKIQPSANVEPLVDCVGPDKKHLQVTQKVCDDFNNAWKPTPTPIARTDIFSFSETTTCESCPANSHCSYGSCSCNDGYVKNYGNGECEVCPENSKELYGSCNCIEGYSKNSSTGKCEKLECPANSKVLYNSCSCNDGYVKNYNTGECEVCPENSKWSYGSCLCNDGYYKDYSSNTCKKY